MKFSFQILGYFQFMALVFNIIFALGLMQTAASLNPIEPVGNQAIFSAKLFNTISQQNINTNVIISSASVQTALALAYMGAEGKTANELRQGLYLGSNDISKQQIAQQFGNLMIKMRSNVNATARMANRIYIRYGTEISPEFNDLAERYFDSGVENINFTDTANAAKKINLWVEEQTENKILNLISPDDLAKDSVAVLVNAIYFKAIWLKTFLSTTKEDFHLSKTSTKKVDMMHQLDTFGYDELADLDAKALSMNYSDTNIQMLVLLPNQLDGLSQLENQLKEVDLTKLLKKLITRHVRVSLPKFKIEFGSSLKSTLETLGMRDIFNKETANFSSLFAGGETFAVSDVLHKAFIQVNETGAEAAGSTALMMHVGIISADKYPVYDIYFKVDHPFFFVLLDADTVYFIGHVTDI